MLKLTCVICICLTAFPALCEPAAREVATIMDCIHQTDGSTA
jgi:hypothetical protein